MDGGAWWAAVHGVAKSRTRLSDFTFTFLFHALEKEVATHSSVLAWRIPGTEKHSGLPSMGSYRVGRDWSDLAAAAEAVQISGTKYICIVVCPSPPSVSRMGRPPKRTLPAASPDAHPHPRLYQCTCWRGFSLFWELHISGIAQYLSVPTLYWSAFLRLIYVLRKVVPFSLPLCYTVGSYVIYFPLPVHTFVLYICVSLCFATLQAGSSVLFLYVYFLPYVTFTTIKNIKKRCRVCIYLRIYTCIHSRILFVVVQLLSHVGFFVTS